MHWALQCNYKLILSVNGIKATRVTGSTTKLESDKETQKGRKKRKKREKKRGKEGTLLRTRETDGLFSDSLLCQL